MAATKRAIVMAMRVVGNKEGEGGTGYGIGNEGGMQQRGQWQWCKSNGDKEDDGQATMMRAMATAKVTM